MGAEAHNPNYVGGDITGGAGTLRQTVFRPTVRLEPLPDRRPGALFLLCFHSSGWRRPRDVRRRRGPAVLAISGLTNDTSPVRALGA